MGEISKVVGQWIVGNVGWATIIVLFILSGLFKIAKIEINPIGWIISWIGNALTKSIRVDLADLRQETNNKFEEIKTDRAEKIQELKNDYDEKIAGLRDDLDTFESRTNANIEEVKIKATGTFDLLTERLNEMERSNDMQTVRQIKAHVLDFANACLNHRRHTKQEFDSVIKENEEYEELVKKYGLKNNVYAEDYQYILKIYHKCQDQNSFLKDEE